MSKKCREALHNIDLGNDFMGMTPKAQATKAKVDVATSKSKASAQQKKPSMREKATYRTGEHIGKPLIR